MASDMADGDDKMDDEGGEPKAFSGPASQEDKFDEENIIEDFEVKIELKGTIDLLKTPINRVDEF